MEQVKFEKEKPAEEDASREVLQKIGKATLEAARKNVIRQTAETGEFFANELKKSELQFAKQLEQSNSRGEIHIPEKEFLVWEEGARDDWEKVQKAERESNLGAHERAEIEIETIAYLNPDKAENTIEAQSGNFYFGRMRKLIDAIQEAGDKKDLETAKGFPDAVAEHLRFKFTPRDELKEEFDTGNPTSTWQRVDEARNRAHNSSIRQLNTLNELAEKYGTPRFTFRNFRTKEYLEDLPPEEDRIAENDRACVEAYYSLAFKSEVARLTAKQRRASAYGLY